MLAKHRSARTPPPPRVLSFSPYTKSKISFHCLRLHPVNIRQRHRYLPCGDGATRHLSPVTLITFSPPPVHHIEPYTLRTIKSSKRNAFSPPPCARLHIEPTDVDLKSLSSWSQPHTSANGRRLPQASPSHNRAWLHPPQSNSVATTPKNPFDMPLQLHPTRPTTCQPVGLTTPPIHPHHLTRNETMSRCPH